MMESTDTISSTPTFNACYDQIKGWVSKEQDITVDSVLILLPRIMRVVQVSVKEKKQGTYKKKLVLSLCQKLVEDCVTDDTVRDSVLAGLNLAGPALVDITVDVALGNINIMKQIKKCKFLCCGSV